MVWIIIIIAIVVVVAVVVGYNRLVSARNRYENAFAQIDVQLHRRHDLIPSLVETAKGYMAHERETLEAVIDARNAASNGLQNAKRNPGDPQSMGELAQAEQGLSGALGRLFALSESYPDLKANQNMMMLSEELSSTENKIAFARQAFNDAVMKYNTMRESVPTNFIAGSFGFGPAELLELEDPEKREVPDVSFT